MLLISPLFKLTRSLSDITLEKESGLDLLCGDRGGLAHHNLFLQHFLKRDVDIVASQLRRKIKNIFACYPGLYTWAASSCWDGWRTSNSCPISSPISWKWGVNVNTVSQKTCHLGVVPRFSCLLVAIVTCFCWLLHRMGKNKCYPLFKRNFEELVVLSTYQTLHLSCNSFRGRWRQAVTGDHLEPPLDGGQVSSRVDLKGESNWSISIRQDHISQVSASGVKDLMTGKAMQLWDFGQLKIMKSFFRYRKYCA